MRHAPAGMLSFGDGGEIVFANAQLHHWLQWPEGELHGKPLDRLLSPASRIFRSTHFFPLLKLHGQADEIHLVLRTQAGEDVPVVVSAVRVQEAGRPAVTHCALMRHVQRKAFESRLVEARQAAEAATVARDQFLAMVSHELRTPLSAIFGWVRLLQSGKLDATQSQRAIDTIERNARAQAVLIDDLLDISRIISGKLRLSPKAIDLAGVVEAAVDTVRPAAQGKDIDLVCMAERSAGIVHADPDRVQQIVWNLAANAVKFTPKGGRVQVRLMREHSRVCIEVSDTGHGIEPVQLPYLFDRFWQAAGEHERAGLGLGLSICKSLVELHGGTIRATSEGLGKGAVFTVTFPLAVAASGLEAGQGGRLASTEEPVEVDVLAGVQVLVVDDDADARSMMRMLLEAAGASVRLASSADEALRALEMEGCHILLTDIGLPGRDGLELIRWLRSGTMAQVAHARALPAVAITGQSRPHDRVRLLRAGFQGHLGKPVEPAEVVAMIRALVGLS